jgi:hypothetical protein
MLTKQAFLNLLLLLLVAMVAAKAKSKPMAAKTVQPKVARKPRLSRVQKKAVAKAEAKKYVELRKSGHDEVSNTEEAAAMRNYRLRSKKRKGLIIKKEASLAQVLFPGVSPEEYLDNEDMVNLC